MTAELRCEDSTEKLSRYDGDALESMTPQVTERPPFSSKAESAGPAPEDSSGLGSGEGVEAVPCTAAEMELKAQLEMAMRRCEMLEAQNMALWQVNLNPKIEARQGKP